MITVYPHEKLGHANHGWLDTSYHFSFSRYFNPDRMGFGALRVVNDDTVKAGSGFDMHPHSDMEIITFVREGAITHKDSRGNEGRTESGDVQVMSAGTGLFHSEFNMESRDTVLYQIWIAPDRKGVAPRWESARFSGRRAEGGRLPLLVSGRPEDRESGALFIHQDAAISGGQLVEGETVEQPVKGQAYILVSSGEVEIGGHTVRKGDGAEVTDMHTVPIKALSDAEVIVIDVPAA